MFIVATVSASGYFMGMRQNRREGGGATRAGVLAAATSAITAPLPAAGVPVVPVYKDLSGGGWQPAAGWNNHLAAGMLPEARPSMPVAQSREDRAARRADRRAYDGAPPLVPHPVNQLTPAACVLCHTTPTRVGDVIAPAMSHPAYPSCTQCHASTSGFGDILAVVPMPPSQPPGGNSFQGKTAPAFGNRAGPGAPPVIPHPLQMRGNCLSCHGPASGSARPTSHPERPNCLQCHATEASSEFPRLIEFLKSTRPVPVP